MQYKALSCTFCSEKEGLLIVVRASCLPRWNRGRQDARTTLIPAATFSPGDSRLKCMTGSKALLATRWGLWGSIDYRRLIRTRWCEFHRPVRYNQVMDC